MSWPPACRWRPRPGPAATPGRWRRDGCAGSTPTSPPGRWSSAVERVPLNDVSGPPASAEELDALSRLIDDGAATQRDVNELIADVEVHPEDRRWIVRIRGEEKMLVAVWLTLRERTLHFESQFMPAPEENVAECYEYLLRCNRDLFAMRFAIGFEDAIYLVGQMP